MVNWNKNLKTEWILYSRYKRENLETTSAQNYQKNWVNNMLMQKVFKLKGYKQLKS